MAIAWADDFSYSYYENLLMEIKSNFNQCIFSQVPELITREYSKPALLLRHDVDLDLNKALEMARLENKLGVKACYMIMVNCPFYSLKDQNNKTIISELTEMGIEIGLHFDTAGRANQVNPSDFRQLLDAIKADCRFLEDSLSVKVSSVSFHRPQKQLIGGSLLIEGLVNAYAADLMGWYLSDSKGNWREGEPIASIKNPKGKLLQLLVHPIWWDKTHATAIDRLQAFYDKSVKTLSIEESRNFDLQLSNHLSITRRLKALD